MMNFICRHKCSACYKQYKKKEHLVEHMRVSYHSFHQPKCDVCKKHCKSFESVREHLKGPLPKESCAKTFSSLGCDLCLKVFDDTGVLSAHESSCRLDPAIIPELPAMLSLETCDVEVSSLTMADANEQGPEVVALDCELVGGGSDGTLDLCARVCLIGENENLIFHSYCKPLIPVTNYRYEITGITEENLINAPPLEQVRSRIEEILCNGETPWRARILGGKARILVGHDLEHDLWCLDMYYPGHLIRDTAQYQPLMRTNSIPHSLKYLTKTYLGYEIQTGIHHPYEDCVAALRIYKKMRSLSHPNKCFSLPNYGKDFLDANSSTSFDSLTKRELMNLSPDALLEMSLPNYKCWCLDAKNPMNY
ncbi:Exoribonuclease II protein [Dioscorea alata]|uniref:Exoribonuclease II protein n=3 Tax=Dioscorea alata TaxID=55571 RepID=A0ACB7U3F1_DIOAL|nr:Exoribonuclease II protein [Dioscorea alata]